MASTTYRPVATAAMGSLLDSRLKLLVLGLQGLKETNGSLMLRLVGANTSTAIAMIVKKAADMIIED